MPEPEMTVLYDVDCGFCRWSLDKVLAWDRGGRLGSMPIQSDEGQRVLAKVPEEARLQSWHLLHRGEVTSAGAAIPEVLDVLPGGKPLAFLLRKAPRLTERGYRLVVANRSRLARLLRVDASCAVRR